MWRKTDKMEKLTKEQFWNLTTEKENSEGYFLQTKTNICEYGQYYNKRVTAEQRKERYLSFYYSFYEADFMLKQMIGIPKSKLC